ncbi:autonomous glycyl radical cofactor [Escherichia coli]|uniref:Autonomous glycyl radical cofactor n=1 Tax=Escherichia coli TaxID=562 RepID=A0A377A2V5_ECOLX|nr:autonomous glycyl radical cofactor [Escherichia coli]STL12934.1 autonomous glycyl radical cofactor [Escherichia coli]
MITGIQITKAANDDLLNSFWLLDSEKAKHVASLQKQVMQKMKWLQ